MPRGGDDLCDATAVTLAAWIARGELSAREVVAAHLARIEAVNPSLNAIVTLTGDRAMADAAAADERQARGEPLGPLHGLPIAHKDLVDTAGILHRYIQGSGSGDTYLIVDGQHPPLTSKSVISQPRSVTLAPNGDLLVVLNDSGYLLRVRNAAPAAEAANLVPAPGASGGLRLGWDGMFGRGYRIERSSSLVNPSWSPVTAVWGQPAGQTTLLDGLPAGPEAEGYYRVLPSL